MIERIKQSLLSNTLIYRMFQNLLIPDDYTVIYKKLSELIKKNFMDYTVYDLGCGDAPFAKYLDKEVNYIGIDVNIKHIQKAQKDYPHFNFECLDLSSIEFSNQRSLIILDGVIHHLDDELVSCLLDKLNNITTYSIFCKDPVYTDNQDFLSRFLMKNDGGKYIRTRSQYEDLLVGFDFKIYDSLLRIPYKHIFSSKNIDLKL